MGAVSALLQMLHGNKYETCFINVICSMHMRSLNRQLWQLFKTILQELRVRNILSFFLLSTYSKDIETLILRSSTGKKQEKDFKYKDRKNLNVAHLDMG